MSLKRPQPTKDLQKILTKKPDSFRLFYFPFCNEDQFSDLSGRLALSSSAAQDTT
jgi:hypothetical protein